MREYERGYDLDMFTFHLFAGAGGGILADLLSGDTPIGAIELEDYPRRVLMQRQLDGILPVFPVWDDVRTFRADNPETAGFIGRLREVKDDLRIAGGFPCQDISLSGKGAGIDGARSGLWGEFARIIGEIRPANVFVENSPALAFRGLGRVLGDLSQMGYHARWGVMGGYHIGATCCRYRMWIVGSRSAFHWRYNKGNALHKNTAFKGNLWDGSGFTTLLSGCKLWGDNERGNSVLGDGLDSWMDRLKAIGNGQVPQVARLALQILSER